MAHFAKIENNIVTQVIVADTQEWCETNLGGEWVQTSYNTQGGVHVLGGIPLRKNYATIGSFYDKENDVFIHPQPYPSWILNTESFTWEAPKPMPNDGYYYWDEKLSDWVKTELI